MEMCVYEIDSRLEERKAFTADVEQFAREKKIEVCCSLVPSLFVCMFDIPKHADWCLFI